MHTAEGSIELQVPQVRETLEPFESVWLQSIGKRSKKLLDLVPAMYVKGMSQRDIEEALVEALGVEGTGRSVINGVCQSLRGEFARWQDRDLSGVNLLYLFLDGIYLKLRPEDKRAVAVLCAYGIQWDGRNLPEEAANRDDAGKPEEAGQPEESGAPEGLGVPADAGQPEDAGESDGAGQPEEPGAPEGVVAPDDVEMSGDEEMSEGTDASDESDQSTDTE